MKIVNQEKDLEKLYLTAKNEAKKYFGKDELYIEKYFKKPRHIEVQIMSGTNRTVHIGERDCSVQRRHQKLIEETPSPVLNDTQRKELLEKLLKWWNKLVMKEPEQLNSFTKMASFIFLK